jgi:hypothetical protein
VLAHSRCVHIPKTSKGSIVRPSSTTKAPSTVRRRRVLTQGAWNPQLYRTAGRRLGSFRATRPGACGAGGGVSVTGAGGVSAAAIVSKRNHSRVAALIARSTGPNRSRCGPRRCVRVPPVPLRWALERTASPIAYKASPNIVAPPNQPGSAPRPTSRNW